MHDKIILKDCLFLVTIGINDAERILPRALYIDIELFTDTKKAAAADRIESTISYTDVHTAVSTCLQNKIWNLVETVAESVCSVILEQFSVVGVHVTVKKPSALHDRNVAYTAVEVTRMRV